MLKTTLGDYLTGAEIGGITARRDRLVEHFGGLVTEQGAARVLY